MSISLEIFGDRWSLLIVRDLMFKGLCTFPGFAAAGERIATNILSERLDRLERAGIISRHVDSSDGRRVRYRLTRKGIDLAPVLVEMIIWAAHHEVTDAPPVVVRRMERSRARYVASVRKRWADASDDAESRGGVSLPSA